MVNCTRPQPLISPAEMPSFIVKLNEPNSSMPNNWINRHLSAPSNAMDTCSFSSENLRLKTAARRFIHEWPAYARTIAVVQPHSVNVGHHISRLAWTVRPRAIFRFTSMSYVSRFKFKSALYDISLWKMKVSKKNWSNTLLCWVVKFFFVEI